MIWKLLHYLSKYPIDHPGKVDEMECLVYRISWWSTTINLAAYHTNIVPITLRYFVNFLESFPELWHIWGFTECFQTALKTRNSNTARNDIIEFIFIYIFSVEWSRVQKFLRNRLSRVIFEYLRFTDWLNLAAYALSSSDCYSYFPNNSNSGRIQWAFSYYWKIRCEKALKKGYFFTRHAGHVLVEMG